MSDIEEAEAWLTSSKYLLDSRELGRARFTVAVGQAIHSVDAPMTWPNTATSAM